MIVLSLLLASFSAAQSRVPDLQGPAMSQLEAAAGGADAAAASADGSKLKKSGDGTAVIGTEHRTVVRDVPGTRDCDMIGADAGGPHGHPIGGCVRTPGHRERVEEDVQTVKIVDRDAYVRRGTRNGALIGAGIGLLGFLALFAGPIGWLIGGLSVVVGAGIGAAVGRSVAKSTPETFTRTEERSATPL